MTSEEVARCLEVVGDKDPWASFLIASRSEEPADAFRACCANAAAVLGKPPVALDSTQGAVRTMIEAGEPLMALGTLLFAPTSLRSALSSGDGEELDECLLEVMREGLSDHGVEIGRLFEEPEPEPEPELEDSAEQRKERRREMAELLKLASDAVPRKGPHPSPATARPRRSPTRSPT